MGDLSDIPPAPRGKPQIEVTFDIDANGIVNVSARDKGTGKEQQIQIRSSGGLSDAEEDEKKKEFIEQKNTADSLIYNTTKSLNEHKEKIDDETKELIETAVRECEEALAEGEDVDNLKAKVDALQ